MTNISTDFSTWSGTAASNQPDSGDTATVQADLQAIQAALRTIFPSVNAAVTPTHTELNYVDGVTSAIQTQLNAKAATGANGDITSLTACTSITAGTVTVATGDLVYVQDVSAANVLKVVTAQSIANLASVGAATTTSSGIVELITTAELQTGTDTTRAVTADAMLNALGFSSRYNSGNQTITSGGALTLAHSLGREPNIIQAWLKCQTAEAGYSIGDKLATGVSAEQGISRGLSIVCDNTNVNVRFGSDANSFVILNKTTGTITTATNGNWRLVIDAWA